MRPKLTNSPRQATRFRNILSGLLALLALSQLTRCHSPENVLVQASPGELGFVLKQNFSGPGSSRPLVLPDGHTWIYRPTSPSDHLSSPFYTLAHHKNRHPRLVISIEGDRPYALTMRMQTPNYQDIGICEKNCSIDAPEKTTAIRLVIQSKNGAASAIPDRITFRVVYIWDALLLAALSGLEVGAALGIIVLLILRFQGKRIERAIKIAKAWSAPYAPARRVCETVPGRRGYWFAVTLMIGLYVLAWGANWKYIYGWLEDDWATYYKALATIHDPKNAFIVRANLLQPYFFLFSYLPLSLGWRVPSIDIPVFGANTGLFRFFLLYTVCYHVGIAFSWAWLAEKLAWRKSAAALSVLFLLTSPTFVLWTPQPDSRIVGLPLALLGIWLLVRKPAPSPLSAGFAGFLFSLGNNLHYTLMYLTVPASIILFALDFLGRWHRKNFWKTWLSFSAGVASVVLPLEFLSHFWVGMTVLGGPTGGLMASNRVLQSTFTELQNLALWGKFGWNLVGLPMLLAASAGGYIFSRRRDRPGPDPTVRFAIGAVIALGMTWILLSGSMPFFRQTSVLQPFIFLFAAVAITEFASLAKAPAMRLFALAVLAILVAWVPAAAAYQVFEGHLGFGKVIQWVDRNKGSRRVGWLMLRVAEYSPATYVARFSADDWIVVHSSMWSGELTAPLASLRPLKTGPGIWGTYAAYAETFAWNHADYRNYPFFTDTRVYRSGDIAAVLRDWNQAAPSQSPIEITRIEPVPEAEWAQTESRLMMYFRPYPDPLPFKRAWVFGNGLGLNSILTLDGKALPTRVDDFNLDDVRLIAVLPDAYRGCAQAFVKDGTRRSNTVPLCVP
jgi:hypothetical protein